MSTCLCFAYSPDKQCHRKKHESKDVDTVFVRTASKSKAAKDEPRRLHRENSTRKDPSHNQYCIFFLLYKSADIILLKLVPCTCSKMSWFMTQSNNLVFLCDQNHFHNKHVIRCQSREPHPNQEGDYTLKKK